MSIQAYLDNNATTRLAPEALAAMTPYLTDIYLNPSSAAGELLGASRPLDDAKRQLAKLLGAPDLAGGVLLTSGASEANSWALHLATSRWTEHGRILTTAIEHPSLLAAAEAASKQGWALDIAYPDEAGLVTAASVVRLLTPRTGFVSIMLANNETGVVQPVGEIGMLIRQICPSAIFHVDATQALGRIPISFDDDLANVDLVSLSAHKFHGPKGVGALVTTLDEHLPALIHGSQAGGQRGGTPDPAAAAGVAVAARLATERIGEMERVRQLRDGFERALVQVLPSVTILGASAPRLPNTSNFIIPGVDAEAVVERLALDGVVIAVGSACSSGSTAPSHVLAAMGIPYEAAKSALRISLSRETTDQELRVALDLILHRANMSLAATS